VLQQIGEWTRRDPAEATRVAGLPDAGALQELAAWLDRLDTAAMVMIWRHWLGQAAPPW
jgi:hypothetical protein